MTDHFRAALVINEQVYDLTYLAFEEGCIVAVAIDDPTMEAQDEREHTVEAIKLATGHELASACQLPK